MTLRKWPAHRVVGGYVGRGSILVNLVEYPSIESAKNPVAVPSVRLLVEGEDDTAVSRTGSLVSLSYGLSQEAIANFNARRQSASKK